MAEYEEDRKMYKAVCSECGKECEVPFEPTEGKPIRCQDCFRKYKQSKGGSNGFNRNSRFGGNRRFGNDNRSERQMYKAKCADCGKECEVPFKPTGDKPVYCRECYANHRD
jgi:CxxC-x17-CxxC domain-containing protein